MRAIVLGALGTVFIGFGKKIKGSENQGTNRDHPNSCIAKIGLNTQESPEAMMRLRLSDSVERTLAESYMEN